MDNREKGFTHYVDLPDETILKYFLLKNLECLIPKLLNISATILMQFNKK
jgi:hypothetical protein